VPEHPGLHGLILEVIPALVSALDLHKVKFILPSHEALLKRCYALCMYYVPSPFVPVSYSHTADETSNTIRHNLQQLISSLLECSSDVQHLTISQLLSMDLSEHFVYHSNGALQIYVLFSWT
jgi:hypothetical protein